jgi:hypothetical protein
MILITTASRVKVVMAIDDASGRQRNPVRQYSYRDAYSKIAQIRHEYARTRSVFIAGTEMVAILRVLGATPPDLAELQSAGDNLESDPTLPFRKTRNGRFCFDFDRESIYRLEPQPFTLTAGEDFVRHDSGRLRRFDEVNNDVQSNTAVQALLRFKALVFRGVAVTPRRRLDYKASEYVCTLFHIRTITDSRLVGEPALEGVHTDGVDHTMTTLLGSENMSMESAVTFIHDMREETAKRWDETNPQLVLGRYRHESFLDTLLILDNERKHSLSPVKAHNPDKIATRDMLILFTRKPALWGHPSHAYDSRRPHNLLPMCIRMATDRQSSFRVRPHLALNRIGVDR